jgi:hypothetical protein
MRLRFLSLTALCVAAMTSAAPQAEDFAFYMLSSEGRRVFAQFGFAPVGLPAPEQ